MGWMCFRFLWIRMIVGSSSSQLITSLRSCFVAQFRRTLWDPLDYSPPGPSVHGIPQARILEGVAIFFSRKSSPPRDWNCVSSHFLCWQADSLLLCHLGRCLERHYVYMLFFPDLILLLALLEQFYFISFTDLHCISKEEWHVPIFIEVIFRKVNEERNRRSSLS